MADRRRAVAALANIRNEQTVEPLLRAASDADNVVAGLAVQALTEMGEVVREQAIHLAQQPEHPLHQSGLAYLKGLLGLPVVWVPPGPFLMGSDKADDPQALDRETPQHEVVLPGYWIGRYPVTVAQFRVFVEASGYDADVRSLEAPDDHPVRHMAWDDALGYCRWLSEGTGLQVTLPSEAEWEKAARGTDGRIYPWGDELPTPDRCNVDWHMTDTTPVGTYSPEGDSPYRCADMAGNVWEWTRSLYVEAYPYEPGGKRETLDAKDSHVGRGGSFASAASRARCAYRLRDFPGLRDDNYGFRVVVTPRLRQQRDAPPGLRPRWPRTL